MLQPYMPEVSRQIQEQLQVKNVLISENYRPVSSHILHKPSMWKVFFVFVFFLEGVANWVEPKHKNFKAQACQDSRGKSV